VPRGSGYQTEREAVEIVRAEEAARGWTPGPQLDQVSQRVEGCDFFSAPPDGRPPHPVEVKGWGEPLVGPSGRIVELADVNAEQFKRASRDADWRLEIVANLTAAREGRGSPQRLTLTAGDVVRRARPWRYRVDLDGLGEQVTTT
jgi:hypothetical protein